MKAHTQLASILLAFFASGTMLYGQTEDRNLRIREFVVMGYQGIQLELSSGKGPYLRTLHELLKTPRDIEAKKTEQLQSLLKTYPNIMDFADQVVLIGTKVEETTQVTAEVPVPSGPGIYTGDNLVNALEHLTRGMALTITLKTGEQLKGTFVEYSAKRLWMRGATRRVISLDDIMALEAPRL